MGLFSFQGPVLRLWWLRSPPWLCPQEGQSLSPVPPTLEQSPTLTIHTGSSRSLANPPGHWFSTQTANSPGPLPDSQAPSLGAKLPWPSQGPSLRTRPSTTAGWYMMVLGTVVGSQEKPGQKHAPALVIKRSHDQTHKPSSSLNVDHVLKVKGRVWIDSSNYLSPKAEEIHEWFGRNWFRKSKIQLFHNPKGIVTAGSDLRAEIKHISS